MTNLEDIREIVRKISSSVSNNEQKKIFSFVTMSDSLVQRTIVANLAMMYSQSNAKVIIIDTDFSQNSIAQAFDIRSRTGLSDFLSNRSISSESIINSTSKQNLSIIPSGDIPFEETSYLMGDPRFEILLENLLQSFDLILVNTPTMKKASGFEEMSRILKKSNGVILVSQIGKERKRELYRMMTLFRNDKTKIMGYISVEG